MRFQKHLLSAAVLVCAGSLVACGGGNSTTPNKSAGNAQGVYSGTSTTGSNSGNFVALVTPDDVVYALYVGSDNSTTFDGVIIGNGSENGTNLTANVYDFLAGGTVNSGSLSGTFVAGASLSGTLTEGSSTTTLSGQVPPTTIYNYATAAQLSTATGSWTGTLLDGETATFTIDSTGAVSGSSSLGCAFTGSVTPDASGKNFFDVTLAFGTTNCLAPGASVSGAGIIASSSGGSYQLIAAVRSSDNTLGTGLLATSGTLPAGRTRRLF